MITKQYQGISPLSMYATADLSSSQYHFVKIDSNTDEAVVIGDADCSAIGVLDNKPKAGDEASVVTHGIVKVVTGAAVTRGAAVQCDTNGCVQMQSTLSGHNILGIAVTGTTTVGNIIEVLLRPMYHS